LLLLRMPFIGDPWEEHEFEDMPQTGLYAGTGLGNSNQAAGLTLEHLWQVMKPIYFKRLGRERQHGLIKAYFFMAFYHHSFFPTGASFIVDTVPIDHRVLANRSIGTCNALRTR
jgi:hypothetical protein